MALNPFLDPVFIAGSTIPLLVPQTNWVAPSPTVLTSTVLSETTFQIDENYRFMEPIKFDVRNLLQTRLYSFGSLERNWDGFGADTPDESTINNSGALLNMLPDTFIQNLDPDDIVLSPYGTIVIDWRRNDQLLSIEIGTSKVGFFTEFENSKYLSLEDTTFNTTKLPDEMVNAFKELFS